MPYLVFASRRNIQNTNRDTALKLLSTHKPTLVSHFGATQPALFGATAPNSAHEGNDLDVLVGFDGSASSAQYFGILFYLEATCERGINSVTPKALRKEIRPCAERDAVYVCKSMGI